MTLGPYWAYFFGLVYHYLRSGFFAKLRPHYATLIFERACTIPLVARAASVTGATGPAATGECGVILIGAVLPA